MSAVGVHGGRWSTGYMAAGALSLVLCGCVPWTVRPIENGESAESSGHATLVPSRYVDSIWDSKLVPTVLNSAVDARTLLDSMSSSVEQARNRYGHRDASGPWYFMVKGEGRVISIDTRSRVGLAFVDVAPFDRQADLSLQIGPVLRGTSLRDAPGIVHFTDFVNQLQFADVANELNDRALKLVLAPIESAKLKGRLVSFAGAARAEDGAQPPIRELVPVRLAVEDGR